MLIPAAASMLWALVALPAATLAAPAAANKPEQIRAVQSPIFHYYLQSYPSNSKADRAFLHVQSERCTHLESLRRQNARHHELDSVGHAT